MTLKTIFDSKNITDEDEREMMVRNIESFFTMAVRMYEQRHRTTMKYVLLYGTVGTWRGEFPGGKVICGTSPFLGDYDDISLVVDQSTGEIIFRYHHHDGVNIMQPHVLSEAFLKRQGKSDWGFDELNDLEVIEDFAEKLNPLKLNKSHPVMQPF